MLEHLVPPLPQHLAQQSPALLLFRKQLDRPAALNETLSVVQLHTDERRAASDERNFVKKGVSWALRAVGRRNQALNAAAVATARRVAESWVGRDALKELTSPAVRRRLAARRSGGTIGR
jgi:hypothetical protein